MIPEVYDLERKMNMLEGSQRDGYLDQIINSLLAKSKLGKIWENAEKARREEDANRAKDLEVKHEVDDVVKKALSDTVKPKKAGAAGGKDSAPAAKDVLKAADKEAKKVDEKNKEDEKDDDDDEDGTKEAAKKEGKKK